MWNKLQDCASVIKFFTKSLIPRKFLKREGRREADSPTAIHTLISWLIHFCINSVHTKDALLFHIMEGAAKWLASLHTAATLTFVKTSKSKGINNSQLCWKIAVKGFDRLIKNNAAVKVWHVQAAGNLYKPTMPSLLKRTVQLKLPKHSSSTANDPYDKAQGR